MKRSRETVPALHALKKMKVNELKDWCTDLGVRKQGLKADLIAALDAARTTTSTSTSSHYQPPPAARTPVHHGAAAGVQHKTSPGAYRSLVPTPQGKKSPGATFFEKYASESDPKRMDLGGFVKLGLELAGGDEERSLTPQHTALLFYLCWKMKAKGFGELTLEGFTAGCDAIKCFSVDEIRNKAPTLLREVSGGKVDPSRAASSEQSFQAFHSFVYDMLRPEGKKYIEKEMAMLALQAIFLGLEGRESRHIELFVKFLTAREKLEILNNDQWKGFLQFSRDVDAAFSGYSDADPWPSLLDDFVTWAKEQAEW
eukprot:CAMPEP_0114116006 /NCGR_PEP_ID=MMETSP0043_2-20121206/4271_1 /TAXON_ID=464988 /ORGANISM="Hemiselmis andersenii, Strain CCMP644" /LENGTH=312 /DNA_ID=CAMNT_0001208305 /DNA_START=23 /DNA_END=958 /DNA_ORIENTATION=-